MVGEKKCCVVTGGRGFAARHLVEMLLRQDLFLVRIADLAPAIQLDTDDERTGILHSALESRRAAYVSFDLRDKTQVYKAVEGAEVVFHMAAPNSSINDLELHYSVNVIGTKNVIEACIELNVKRLIYTSSSSVVFDGIHEILDGDETIAYPAQCLDSYSATKKEGEIAILKANGTNGLLTCSLRPSGIFGPGDRLLVPSLVSAGRAGKSKFIIGDGNNVFDFTYVENVAHSHICADRVLAAGGEAAERVAGKAFFITNLEPMKFWDFTACILGGLGYERPRVKISAAVMMPIAYVIEGIYKLFGPYGMKVPQLIPSRIRILSLNRSFNCSKATELLGYKPIVTLEEGLKMTIDSYSHLRAVTITERECPSKLSRLLGSGKIADILLWRNKLQTVAALILCVAVYYNFIATQHTIIAALSKILLLTSILLFLQGNLPNKILGYNIQNVSQLSFQLTDKQSQRIVTGIASMWNYGFNIFRSLCKGNDWSLFLKVAVFLVILGFLGSISFSNVYILGLFIGFVALYFYERNERAIDPMFLKLLSSCRKLKNQIVSRGADSKKIQ